MLLCNYVISNTDFGTYNHIPIKGFPKPTFCEYSDKNLQLRGGEDLFFFPSDFESVIATDTRETEKPWVLKFLHIKFPLVCSMCLANSLGC